MKKVENPSENTLAGRIWREGHKHPCVDCGKPCSFNALRCQSCNQKTLNLPRKRDYFCIDCGVLVTDKLSTRCTKCSSRFQRGEDHPNWKGGRFKGGGGYIYVKQLDHPMANKVGYVFEHILAWEASHGKPLPEGWVIHHLNGIKDDNRPKNLEGMPNKKHYLVLQAKAKRIQELEALLNGQSQLI